MSTLTYYCLINNRPVFESFTSRREAIKRAHHLSKHQMAKEIKIVNHS